MDLIISAAQGRGKTQLALSVIRMHLRVKDLGDIISGLLIINEADTVGDNASRLAQRLRDEKPAAILFDGDSLATPTHLLTAVDAVKRYREQTGRPDTIAVYVERQPRIAVVLANQYNASKGKPLYSVTDGGVTEEYGHDMRAAVEAETLMPYAGVLGRVIEELQEQDQRFGADRKQDLITWLGILNEEVLEVTRGIVNYTTAATAVPYNVLRRDLVSELTQVAAVAIQILKSYEGFNTPTNEFKSNETE